MKKLITICLIIATTFGAKAQTSQETLEWLNTKKIDLSWISGTNVSGGDLLIDEKQIKAYGDKGESVYIPWSYITDIKLESDKYIEIVSNYMKDGKNIYIKLRIYDNEKRLKYFKALKHMATLNGAKLVNDDLFKD